MTLMLSTVAQRMQTLSCVQLWRVCAHFVGNPAPRHAVCCVETHLCDTHQMAGGTLDPAASERLPTAATCMNLLKLPPYRSPEQMRAKLLLAIEEASGFALS